MYDQLLICTLKFNEQIIYCYFITKYYSVYLYCYFITKYYSIYSINDYL